MKRGTRMIIGLTGSIASGKSTVSAMLKERGLPIVDADEIARLVVEPGTSVIEEIRETFGDEVIQEDGTLNRGKLGEIIFGDEQNREKLNGIMHPAIRTEMLRQKEAYLTSGEETVIMDIPLLFESKLQSFVEKIIVVTVTPENQKKRLIERNGLTEREALERMQSQLPLSEKEVKSDAILDNNGTIKETANQLDHLLKKWKIKYSFISE